MDSDLDAILSRYPAVARANDAPEPLRNAGGLSGSTFWRYTSGLGPMLLRAWPVDGPPRRALDIVHGWLADAGDLGFIPLPVIGLDGQSLLERAGRLWELTPWMPGAAETSQPPPLDRVRAAFAALAAFHQRLSRHRALGASPGMRGRLDEWLSWTGGGFDEVAQRIASRPDDPFSGLAAEWLAAARRRAAAIVEPWRRATIVVVPLQPCLRDVRPEHFLFTGPLVTGLVDFGAMRIETVAADLSRLLSEWSLHDPMTRGAALNAYSSIRPLSADETTLIEVFDQSSAFLLGGHWVRWHFVEGRAFRDPGAVGRGIAKGLTRLATLPP